MLYVSRDSQGNISELHPMPVGAAKEGLEADNPEVLQFIHERWRQNELTSLDRDFVRVIGQGFDPFHRSAGAGSGKTFTSS